MENLHGVLEEKATKINQIKTKQINQKLNYYLVNQIIRELPFEVNKNFYGAIAKHMIRIGLKRFKECVAAAVKAYNPEKYLMKCLVNESRSAGCDPRTGSQSNFTG